MEYSIYVNCDYCHLNKEHECANSAIGCCNYKLYVPVEENHDNNTDKKNIIEKVLSKIKDFITPLPVHYE